MTDKMKRNLALLVIVVCLIGVTALQVVWMRLP